MLLGDLDDLVGRQVRAHGRVLAPLADDIGLIRLLAMHRQPVFVTVHRHRLERQLVRGAEDADGNLAAVGHEDLLELHDGAVGAQPLVDRVGVRVRLAIFVRRAVLAIALHTAEALRVRHAGRVRRRGTGGQHTARNDQLSLR